MADDPKTATPPDAAPPAGEAAPVDEAAAAAAKKKKLLLIGGGAGALLLVVLGVVAFFMLSGGKDDAAADAEHAAPHSAPLALYDVPQMSINLTSTDGVQRFMRTKLALELASPDDVKAAENLLPRLQDDWNSYLRQLRFEDVQGSAALERMKNNLEIRARQVLAPIPVNNVLIRELLVQ